MMMQQKRMTHIHSSGDGVGGAMFGITHLHPIHYTIYIPQTTESIENLCHGYVSCLTFIIGQSCTA